MSEKKVRVGIIGIGNIGTIHANNILAGKCPEITLAAVADINPARLDWCKSVSPETKLFGNADEMLDSGEIDACIVSVPHFFHPEYAVKCMKRGIHVMVEKPAGVYTKQVLEMNAESEKHPKVVFGVMFNQRTNHIYRKMRELVQSGIYGSVRRTNWIITNWYRPQAYYDSGDWRATWSGEGGGVLLNQCPHQLDLWQWICGMPVRVESHMGFGKWHDIEVEDDVTTYVEYENGATGIFITTTGDPCGCNRFEIQLDRAKLIADGDTLTVTETEMTEQEFSKENKIPFGCPEKRTFTPETDGRNEQHVGVLNSWAGCILHGTPLVADGKEGINGLELSNAMHLSAFTGKTVSLPIDGDLYYSELMKRVATSRRKTGGVSVFADASDTYSGT